MILNQRSRVISALGLVEIFAWGTSFYLPAVLSAPVAADTGWPPGLITAGVSLGLLAAGLVATPVGRLIRARGGRQVMAGAMALIATGLTGLALAPGIGWFLASWAVIGLGMGGGLYDAAFSTLGRIYGMDARRAITTLTLWGGFASTVCWPITALLVAHFGWRGACLTYAGLHLVVTVPLCLLVLPRQQAEPRPPRSASRTPGEAAALADPRFWLIALAATMMAVIASLWAMHLMTLLTARGMSLAAAVGLGTLIGPAQVAGRVIEMLSGGRHHPLWTMAAATIFLALGFAGLIIGVPAAAALIAYGAGNGLWSIARGALPMALFGPKDYPAIMGRLATPSLIASAAGPTIGAWLITSIGPEATLKVLGAFALVPVLAMVLIARRMLKG